MAIQKQWQPWYGKLDGYEQEYFEELEEKIAQAVDSVKFMRAEINRLEQRARQRYKRDMKTEEWIHVGA
jgi:BMFP domain-containing protein YqiC